MIELPEGLRHAVSQLPVEPLRLIDPATDLVFVLVPLDEYQRLIINCQSPTESPVKDTRCSEKFPSGDVDLPLEIIEEIRTKHNVFGEIIRIPGSLYAVTDCGKIFSFHKSSKSRPGCVRPLETHRDNGSGYIRYRLRIDGQQKSGNVHNLVAKLFIPRVLGQGEQVRHKDGTRENNRVSNLEWGTYKENTRDRKSHGRDPLCGERNPHAKLSELQVLEIRKLFEIGLPVAEIASCFGVSSSTIADIRNGRSWKKLASPTGVCQ